MNSEEHDWKRKLNSGDPQTVNLALKEIEEEIARYIRRRIPCEADVNDIHQNTSISLFKYIQSIDSSGSEINDLAHLFNLAKKIARLRIIDFWRRKSTDPILTGSDLTKLIDESKNNDQVQKNILTDRMLVAIEKLPEIDQAILKLVFRQWPYQRIAEELGKSYTFVKSRIQRARIKIREIMERDGGLE